MSKEEIYQFIKENDVSIRWDEIDGLDTLSAWIPALALSDFSDMFSGALSDAGRPAHLCQDGSVWVDLGEMMEYYGLEPDQLYPKPSFLT